MVRVISVHHFASQNVFTIEQPTASTVTASNKLLIALSSHCVEVRDLNHDGDVLFTFPTVDEVAQIHHCLNGDYVATLESKFNRQNRELNFIRVYVNWDSVAALQQSKMNVSGASLGATECGMVQPMRARIAGRVTPSTNQSELASLEMIEIPTKRNPNALEVCQISGNILIVADKLLTIYRFDVKVHDISKLKFIDFEEMPFQLELAFLPTHLALCENYVACMSSDAMHLFRVHHATPTDVESQEPVMNKCNNDTHDGDDENFNDETSLNIDYRRMLADEMNDCIGGNRRRLTVNLPMVMRENSAIYRHSPFTHCDRDLLANVKASSAEARQSVTLDNLIQLKLRPIQLEHTQQTIGEEFRCMLLKPLYIDETLAKQQRNNNNRPLAAASSSSLTSAYRTQLYGVACLIATQQEAYLYQFCEHDATPNADRCVAVYPFTAPVYRIVMEDYLLHALTETGLETYTLRIAQNLCRNLPSMGGDSTTLRCPPPSVSSSTDTICLVGLRPFLNIEQLLLADNRLVLFANADSSPTHSIGSSCSSTSAAYWTVYNLELPSPKTIFHDISIVAQTHRIASAQTYAHLINEAHMILRVALLLGKWTSGDAQVVRVVRPHHANVDDTRDAYRRSCALLADHYIMCTQERDYQLALPFYRMAGVHPYDVVKRVRRLQVEHPTSSVPNGLIQYLKAILFDVKYVEMVNAHSRQHFCEAILDLFEKHNFDELPKLIIKVGLLREYSSDKLINVLTQGNVSTHAHQIEKTLALIILQMQRGNLQKAKSLLLDELTRDDLAMMLVHHHEMLFEQFGVSSRRTTVAAFSEFAILLMTHHAELVAELLHGYVVDKHITLSKLLKVFLEYLPASIGNNEQAHQGSRVLQLFLEAYFARFFARYESAELGKIVYERGTHEAIKLLVRSYLSQLQLLQMKGAENKDATIRQLDNNLNNEEIDKDQNQEKVKYRNNHLSDGNNRKKLSQQNDNYLFARLRHEYLNKMPPFNASATPFSKVDAPSTTDVKHPEADRVLRKLQALLCSQAIPNQVIIEVNAFLALNENLRGRLSLQTIIMTMNEAVLLLIDAYPQCLLQYGKDCLTKPDEWKFLIATVQRRILHISESSEEENRVGIYYKKLLKDILTHVATTMNLEHLINVFPQHMNYSASYIVDNANHQDDILNEIQDYEPFIVLCKETMHANQIKKLITATGQQLLCTLNL